MELATKFGIKIENGAYKFYGDPAYVRDAFEASLKRLKIDCIDLYYQHRTDTRVPIEITVFITFSNLFSKVMSTPQLCTWYVVTYGL